MSNKLDEKLKALIEEKVESSLTKNGRIAFKPKKRLNEALVTRADSFVLKTEKLSRTTKEQHENLYKKYSESFNKVSSELDAVNKYEAGSFGSRYRSLKMDECYNLNAVKLHELYFSNIGDLASEVAVDSLPFIKLSRDFGNFENWQFDFMACAMSSREGWAVVVYEPFKNVYMNVCVDEHTIGIPVGTIPVLVMDMWSHSYYNDYQTDKRSYLINMMREINWDVVEARMVLAEKSDLSALYFIKPVYDNEPEKLLNRAAMSTQAPIEKVLDTNNKSVPSTTPAAPLNNGQRGSNENK